MVIRILRVLTKDIQSNGEFYIDTLQYKQQAEKSDIHLISMDRPKWLDVPIFISGSQTGG